MTGAGRNPNIMHNVLKKAYKILSRLSFSPRSPVGNDVEVN
jgi:hypothetical protein